MTGGESTLVTDERIDLAGVPILVTGGAGFIGSHLVDALVARQARVRVLDNLVTGRRENLAGVEDRVELIVGDIRDRDISAAACQGVELVFHQAALGSVPRSLDDPATTIDVNVAGTAAVFAAARDARVRRVVYASSSSVYGDSDRLPKREGEEGRPLSPYALSKVMNERLAEVFARCYGMELVGLRYFNVYGPRQDPAGPYAAVVPRWLAAVRAGTPPTVFGDGEQSRDFTFVLDAVMANLLAAVAPTAVCGRAYNVAGGRRTTLKELARLLCDGVGRPPQLVYAAERPGDVRHSHASLALAAETIGYRPLVDVETGIAVCMKG